MAFEIPGNSFTSITQKVEYLSKRGINTFMSNGKFYCDSVFDVLKSGCVKFSELNLNKVQEAISMEKEKKRNKKYNYTASGKRVFLTEDSDRFVYIVKQINMKTGDFEYVMVVKDAKFKNIKLDKTLKRGMTSFEIDMDSPLLKAALDYNNQKISLGDNAFMEFKADRDGAFLNIASPDMLSMGLVSANLGNNPAIKEMYDSIQYHDRGNIFDRLKRKYKDKIYKKTFGRNYTK